MRKSAVAIIAALAAAGCGQVHAEDSGPTVSRSYQIGNFQEIEVAGPYDVEVRTGGTPGVSARGSQKLLERTIVEVRGNRLVIRPQQRNGWFNGGWSSSGKANFTVTVPQLTGAAIAGSGDIRVDRIKGDDFHGDIHGSGGLNVAALDVRSLKLTIAGSGGVKAGSGSAQSASYDISGSGDIDAREIAANDANVSIAGSGSVRAHASGSAKVSIMGSGDVQIGGGAKCSVHKAGSGDVRCS